ncbi:MAG TPA: LysM domain-containing protein [Gemmatimonadaceae bacterium]|jgi:hypothetical protein
MPAAANASDSVQTVGRTHTVKKGDTLWDLAHAYLSDPFLWPEIYRLNTATVQDPHWIYPGQVLHLPGDVQTVAADETVTDQAEPRFEPTAVAMRSGGPTVFKEDISKRLSHSDSRFSQGPLDYQHTTVRPGEVYAAPWLDVVGGPASQGKLVAEADLPGIAKTIAVAQRLGPDSRAYVTLPAGIVAAKGDRLMIFHRGAVLPEGGQVMEPTAIVQVEATNDGDATTVRIVQQFGEVLIGQGVIPLDRFTMAPDVRPAPLALGPESKVVYVPSNAVLPSVQSYVILDATSRDGVKQGDQFTLYRAREKAPVPGTDKSVQLPEEPIALAQVVKVTDHGTTAIILDQRQPAVKTGVAARLTARMP